MSACSILAVTTTREMEASVATCVVCGGSGECKVCQGTGQVQGGDCPYCHGYKKCQACMGTGQQR